VNQIKTNVEENSKDGIDTRLVVEAITAVGTLAGGIIMEVASKLPKPECKGSGEGGARETVIAEVDKIVFSSLGLPIPTTEHLSATEVHVRAWRRVSESTSS
jgi:hypothetical protein